jgi:beta-lactamase superfamily II metal-dependent hydrolase
MARTSPPPPAATRDAIRIRMYRVGFGDCFLVSLPHGKHILVDCGVHAQGDLHTIEKAVDDIVAESGGHVALLVATHAHRDHISGFAAFEDKFRTITFDTVWLPWTENPKDAQARKLRQKQLALVNQIAEHLRLAGADNGPAMSALMNIAGNERALQNLRQGFGSGELTYVKQGQSYTKVGGISGLTVQVLGPPSDREFLARMDPPAGQRFLRAGPGGQPSEDAVKPFPARWKVRTPKAGLSEKDRAVLRQFAESPADALAFALDSALNNTSIVAVFSYGGRQLLFPGDAQYGNWQAWLEEEGAGDILSGVDFYKVAHHGSFNATPKRALEKMRLGKFAAMISTQNKPWPSIPLPNLVKALEHQTGGNMVRSDSLAIPGVSHAPKGPAVAKLPAHFSKGPFWYDYTLAL